MSMIRADHLTFSYAGAQPVFEDVGFVIVTEWKLALVGRNGRGKTTLLQLLAGRYAYSGNIHASVRFSYFPCEIQDPDQRGPADDRSVCAGVGDAAGAVLACA